MSVNWAQIATAMASQISATSTRAHPPIVIETAFQMNAIQIVMKMASRMLVKKIATKMVFLTIVKILRTAMPTALPTHVNLQTIATRMGFPIGAN